ACPTPWTSVPMFLILWRRAKARPFCYISEMSEVFNLKSEFAPAGDQPKAIQELTDGVKKGLNHQTLLGVTGSGKTFTMANVIANIGKPTLVIAHNKTL